MKLETAYNLGQPVFFMLDNQPTCYHITKIIVRATKDDYQVAYEMGDITKDERFVFPSREDLVTFISQSTPSIYHPNPF